MENPEIIAIAVIVLIIGAAIFYIVKSKKSGKKCIGCPYGCCCSAKNGTAKDGESGCCCSQKQADENKEPHQHE